VKTRRESREGEVLRLEAEEDWRRRIGEEEEAEGEEDSAGGDWTCGSGEVESSAGGDGAEDEEE